MSESVRIRAAAAVAVVEDTVLRPKTLRPVLSVAMPTPEERQQLANRRAAQVFAIVRESTDLTQVDAAILTGDCSRTLGNWERADVDLRALRAFVQLLEIRAAQRAKGGR
jgi:hypothetical protein